MITVKLLGNMRNAFGNFEFLEHTASMPCAKDIAKGFSCIKKNQHITLQVNPDKECYAFEYDTMLDAENDIVTVHKSPQWNITETVQMSTKNAKKFALEMLKKGYETE